MQNQTTQTRFGARSAATAIATALLVALLGLGAFGVRGGFAQESTPTIEESDATTATAGSTASVDPTAAYDEFVAGLAANLGVDAVAVDAAITQTFTDMVAARLADGEISADAAAELTERITAGDVPFGLGWLGDGHSGRGGMGGFDGPGDRGTRGDRMPGTDDQDDTTDDTTSDEEAVGGGATEELDPAGTPVAVN